MKILATYSIKGGVGKTAAAVNLAWLASQSGLRTLLWDLDPQGAASWYFRIRPRVRGGGRQLVQGRTDAADVLKGTDFEGLELLPADFSYRHLDLDLEGTRKPRKRLAKTLKPLRGAFDLALLDCPPSISRVSDSVFRAADVLLVPAIPTTLSLRTVEQLAEHLSSQGRLEKLRMIVLFCLVDRRKTLHKDICENWTPPRSVTRLETTIPASTWVERMGVERAPIGHFAPRSEAARSFHAAWRELLPVLAPES